MLLLLWAARSIGIFERGDKLKRPITTASTKVTDKRWLALLLLIAAMASKICVLGSIGP
jgi:hypothetical protein